jgi:alkylhydroperoxidase family enzyme
MPRLRPIEDHEATETQRLLIETARINGAPDPLCAQIYVRSEAGRNWLRMWNELLNGGGLPIPLKECVRVLISMKHFCGYCSTVRSRIAQERGLTEEKILATMDFEKSDLFDAREKAALRFAKLFKAGDDAIDSDSVYDELKRYFSEERLLSWRCFARRRMEWGSLPGRCRCGPGVRLASCSLGCGERSWRGSSVRFQNLEQIPPLGRNAKPPKGVCFPS